MKKHLSIFTLICVTLLVACGTSNSSTQPSITTTSAPPTTTLSPTLTSTPEPTFSPTLTPTPRLPVSLGTAIPDPGSSLSADNLDQIVELARWGKGVVTDASYSPDGKLIAVASTLGVSIYQADTLEEMLYFETSSSVTSLTISHDGNILATGLIDNTVKIWTISDGSLLKSLYNQKEEETKPGAEKVQINTVAFSPDDILLASGLSDGTVNLWQVSDGTLVLSPKTKQGLGISSVFFSPDGNTIFSSSYDGTTYSRNVSDGEITHIFGGKSINDAVLSADGKVLVTYDFHYSGTGSSLVVWDVESGQKIRSIPAGEQNSFNYITSIALSPDGKLLAAAWRDHTAKTWSVTNGASQNSYEDLRPKDGWFYYVWPTIAFSLDGQSLLMTDPSSIGVWNVGNGALLQTAVIKSDAGFTLALSPDGQILASVEGPNVFLRQIADGRSISVQDKIQSVGDLAFIPDGKTLVVNMIDSTVRFWPLTEQGMRKSFETAKKEYIENIAISPDGQILALAVGYPQGKVELRQTSDGLLLKSKGLISTSLNGIAFSPNGEFLTVSSNGQILLFNVSSGRLIETLNGDNFSISSDGTLLAGSYKGKSLRIWKIPEVDVLLTVADLPDNISSTTFSPDGKLLVVGYTDGTIEVRLVSDGTLLKSWDGHSESVSDILFTSDGKKLITTSYDGTIRMWGIKP